jgi:ribulose 1,5-bisphosphate synthetase/thiazole synthase
MNSNSGQTVSIWMTTEEKKESTPLSQNMNTDVCVVGAGIAGMTTAYLLTRAGKAVIVLAHWRRNDRADNSASLGFGAQWNGKPG